MKFLVGLRGYYLTHGSLRSKRFRGKFRCFSRAKVGARAKKRKRGEGERREGNACRQTPGIWKTPTCSVTAERIHRNLKLSSVVINWPIKCFAFRNGSDPSRTRAEPKQTSLTRYFGISTCTLEESQWVRATNAGFVVVILKLNLVI